MTGITANTSLLTTPLTTTTDYTVENASTQKPAEQTVNTQANDAAKSIVQENVVAQMGGNQTIGGKPQLRSPSASVTTADGTNATAAKTNSGANVDLLLAQLSTLLDQSDEDSLKANMQLARKAQEAQQGQAVKDAEERDKQIEEQNKHKLLKKIFGPLMKVIGAIVSAIGAVFSVVTGGASLALTAIGIGLTMVQEITKAATGGDTLMDMAMKGIMKGLTKLFEKMGLSEKDSKIATLVVAIVATVAAVIASIAAKVFGGGAGGGAASNMAKNVVQDVAQDVTKQIVQEGAERIMGTASKGIAREFTKELVGEMLEEIPSSLAEGLFSNTTGAVLQEVMKSEISGEPSTDEAVGDTANAASELKDKLAEMIKEMLESNNMLAGMMTSLLESKTQTMQAMAAMISGVDVSSAGAGKGDMLNLVSNEMMAHAKA